MAPLGLGLRLGQELPLVELLLLLGHHLVRRVRLPVAQVAGAEGLVRLLLHGLVVRLGGNSIRDGVPDTVSVSISVFSGRTIYGFLGESNTDFQISQNVQIFG